MSQAISVFGTGLTGFALGVWVFQETQSITLFALIAASGAFPGLLLGPFGGVLIDRFDRKWVILLADSLPAVGVATLLALLLSDHLELWHIYGVVTLGAVCSAVQIPACQASIPLLIEGRNFSRANAALQLGDSFARVLAPLCAGILLGSFGLEGVIALDLATYAVAALLLLFVRIPTPPHSSAGIAADGGVWRKALFGWKYISQRPGLKTLALYFALLNFLIGLVLVLVTPLVLSLATEAQLGVVLSLGSLAMLMGGLLMSLWGGSDGHVRRICTYTPLLGIGLFVISLRPSVTWIAAGLITASFVIPVLNASNGAVWQTHVEPDLQGRVFAMRRLIAQFSAPLAYLVAGPLADHVFEPLLEVGGPLAGSLGTIFGVGPGRGIALLFSVAGLITFVVSLVGSSLPRLQSLDERLPSHQSVADPQRRKPTRA